MTGKTRKRNQSVPKKFCSFIFFLVYFTRLHFQWRKFATVIFISFELYKKITWLSSELLYIFLKVLTKEIHSSQCHSTKNLLFKWHVLYFCIKYIFFLKPWTGLLMFSVYFCTYVRNRIRFWSDNLSMSQSTDIWCDLVVGITMMRSRSVRKK